MKCIKTLENIFRLYTRDTRDKFLRLAQAEDTIEQQLNALQYGLLCFKKYIDSCPHNMPSTEERADMVRQTMFTFCQLFRSADERAYILGTRELSLYLSRLIYLTGYLLKNQLLNRPVEAHGDIALLLTKLASCNPSMQDMTTALYGLGLLAQAHGVLVK